FDEIFGRLVNRTGRQCLSIWPCPQVAEVRSEGYDGVNVKPSSIQPVRRSSSLLANRAAQGVTPPYWLRCNVGPRSRRRTPYRWDTPPSGSPSSRCEGC